jgi:hypothetical protein
MAMPASGYIVPHAREIRMPNPPARPVAIANVVSAPGATGPVSVRHTRR